MAAPVFPTDAVDAVHELAQQLRVDSIRCSTAAGSGHPTSCLSAADLMAVLLSRNLRWNAIAPPGRGPSPDSDHLIFSKGHASPLLYAMLKAVGVIDDAELLTFRKAGSRLQGHPVPLLPGVDVATGSLGQGLPIGVGVALSGKYLEKVPYRVWVLLGDSEVSEGSIWEAFAHAGHYGLDNLIAILDMNRLGQRGETPLGWNAEAYAARARAFGWRAIEVDGHDLAAIGRAYDEALRRDGTPALVVARTHKGRGVSFLEDKPGWHGKALDPAQAARAIAELGGVRHRLVAPPPAPAVEPERSAPRAPLELPRYERGEKVATRRAYGDALDRLGAARKDVVVMDGEVSNSTCAETFAKSHPERYFEMYIAEQQLVAAGVGMSVRKHVPFISSFGAFFTRAYDFIRMAAVSRANVRICGSHAGVAVGEDGPSQMALEDLAMMRAVCGSTVLYPCCANQTARLVAAMADRDGIVYLRTTRGATPVLYEADEAFPIGKSRKIASGDADRVTIVAAGITVHESLAARERLAERGIGVTVVDAYSIKPLDVGGIRAAARATGGRVVVAEDHWAEGGLGEAVMDALSGDDPIGARVEHLAVREMPGSGTPEALLHAAGIDADAIVAAVERLLAT
jgi:transketolase